MVQINFDLLLAQKLAYEPLVLKLSNLFWESESRDYAACRFKLNSWRVIFRCAKITPTKVGQFVTFWKRLGVGPIMPYDAADQFDFLIVSVRSGEKLGQFVFSKEVLLKQGVLSQNGVGGKRAIRVYPPWDVTDSGQAKKTQTWQQQYFIELQPKCNLESLKALLK